MKRLICLILAIFYLAACRKDKIIDPIQKTNITYSLDSLSTVPGSLITLKSSELISKDTCTIQLAGKSIVIAKIDSTHYAFYVPVIAPGTYSLDLKKLNAQDNPEVIIREYKTISNPTQVISAVMLEYNNLADSMAKNSFNNTVTSEDAIFMRQLMDQLSKIILLCTEDEKLMLAYQLQSMELDGSSGNKVNVDTTYFSLKKVSRENASPSLDPSMISIDYAISGGFKTAKAMASGAGVSATIGLIGGAAIGLATGATEAALLGGVIIALAKYYQQVKAAAATNDLAFETMGIAEDPVSEINPSDIIVSTEKDTWTALNTWFRTICKSDEINSLNDAYSNIIAVSSLLEQFDKKIKLTFDDIKIKYSQYFDKIQISYSSYVSQLLITPKKKIEPINNEFVSVTKVSNPDITVTAVADGAKGLKLSFDNPSKNITSETDFTFELTYTQSPINNKVSIIEQRKFVPVTKPTISTSVVVSVTSTTASSGGIITNNGAGIIISKGLCWSTSHNPTINDSKLDVGPGDSPFIGNINDLTPGKTYFTKAYATNSAGTSYGSEVSFKTLNNNDSCDFTFTWGPPPELNVINGSHVFMPNNIYQYLTDNETFVICTPTNGGDPRIGTYSVGIHFKMKKGDSATITMMWITTGLDNNCIYDLGPIDTTYVTKSFNCQ